MTSSKTFTAYGLVAGLCLAAGPASVAYAQEMPPVPQAIEDAGVVRVGTNRLGGKVVWTVGERGLLCYYAHLDRWAPGLAAGQLVRRGQRLGSVGNTGNARTTRPHLHFETRPLHRGLMAVDPVPVLGGEVARRRR